MPTSNHDAICLRRTAVGEADWVVHYLTRDAGKLAVMARSARQAKAANAAACQPGVVTRLQLARRAGGSSMPVLAQATVLAAQPSVDYGRGVLAAYLVELVDHVLPDGEPHDLIYDLLTASLAALPEAADPRIIQHSFELALLGDLGFDLVLDRCVQCSAALAEREVLFDARAGGLVHADHGTGAAVIAVSPAGVRVLRRLARPSRYELNLMEARLPVGLAREVAEALRAAVRWHLDVEPRSAALLDEALAGALDERPAKGQN